LGWTQAQKREVGKIQPGQVLEIIRGPDKGRYWTVASVEKGKATAADAKGERRMFTRAHAGLFDVCERRELKVAVGDALLTRSGTRSERGEIVNGELLEVVGWDAQGNPVAKDGRSVVGRNFTHGYASTSYRVQGDAADKVLLGFDRDSVRWASQKIAYVMASRGRIDLELFVENIADLSQIQNRKGDRKAATEMALEPDQNDRRAEVELFRQLQRLRSPGVAETDRAKALDRCRQAAEAIRKSEVYPARKMSAYERNLWKRAAEKYPIESRTAEQQEKIERKIARMVQEHEHHQVTPPAAYQQEHGLER
ncbi:MAG: hypothetical protein JO069_12745, partial [Verrucomicrobia bacterium]|nr:hypothetical protein [Verrucomicrobiota bacterium]